MYNKYPAKDFKAIISATFPGYKKRQVYVVATDAVTLGGLNWSGGSRTEYKACTTDGQPIPNKVNMAAPPPWENPFEGARCEIPQGVVIVQGGCFIGKPATLFINCNPADMPKWIAD